MSLGRTTSPSASRGGTGKQPPLRPPRSRGDRRTRPADRPGNKMARPITLLDTSPLTSANTSFDDRVSCRSAADGLDPGRYPTVVREEGGSCGLASRLWIRYEC